MKGAFATVFIDLSQLTGRGYNPNLHYCLESTKNTTHLPSAGGNQAASFSREPSAVQLMRNETYKSLPRLEPGYYRGQAYVHWVMTIQDRRTGWLSAVFHNPFREILTHTAFRYAFACPIYCLMPDHMHMLWLGIDDRSDQLKASEYFRKRLGEVLKELGLKFQHQPYDHVLKDDEKLESEVGNLVEYIARNPERRSLVGAGQFQLYPFTNCLVPSYPELKIWQPDFWTRFWRCYSFLRKNGLFRPADEQL